jgi:protein-S-isoprenylcysteine O-methyltransferase Ste14
VVGVPRIDTVRRRSTRGTRDPVRSPSPFTLSLFPADEQKDGPPCGHTELGVRDVQEATARKVDTGANGGRAPLELIAGGAAPRQGRDWWEFLTKVTLASVLICFAYIHFMQWRETGRAFGLVLVALEVIQATLFITRRRARGTSRSLVAWVAAPLGSYGMMATSLGYVLFGPPPGPLAGLGALSTGIQVFGLVCAGYSLLMLGRSFGVVAANRGIQTRGAYRLVRHPAYASYLIVNIGYLLENPTVFNVGVVVMATGFQLVRIAKEEEFLSQDPAYRAYRARVRYRLVPFLY